MLAWRVSQLGDPATALERTEIARPEPAEGDVLIQVAAAALNYPDILLCRGQYQVRPPLPFTPGLEVAGVIVVAGAQSRLLAGARVAALPRLPNGGLAEYVVVPAAETLPIPDEMTFDEAAALPIVYQTAHLALHRRAGLQPGEVLLVHGAAGGAGSAAVQVGKAAGARVFAAATGAERAQRCLVYGADVAIDNSAQDFVAVVNEATDGRGADVIFDPIGGDTFDRSRKCIAFEGRLLAIGFAGGTIPSAPISHVLVKNYSIVGVHWGLHHGRHPDDTVRVHAELIDLYRTGAIRPEIGLRVRFDHALDGFVALVERKVIGKIVVQRRRMAGE